MAKTYIVGRSVDKTPDQALMDVYRKTEGSIKTALADMQAEFRRALEGREL
jgi:hypothetical protein